MTAFYSIRLIYLTFIANTNSKKEIYIGAHEPSFNILFPLLLLALGSIFVGYWGKEVILSNVIPPIVSNYVKVVPLILSTLGVFLAIIGYDWGLPKLRYFPINYKKIIYQNVKNKTLLMKGGD